MDKVQRATEAGGGRGRGWGRSWSGMWSSLYAFCFVLFFLNFLHACPSSRPLWYFFFIFIFYHPRRGVRGRSKAVALQRNVVYTVTGWMDGWMNGVINEWMNGRARLKTRKPASWGRSRSWTLCLITVLLLLFFFCSIFCFSDKQRRVLVKEKPSRHEDSPVLFCHFLP